MLKNKKSSFQQKEALICLQVKIIYLLLKRLLRGRYEQLVL